MPKRKKRSPGPAPSPDDFSKFLESDFDNFKFYDDFKFPDFQDDYKFILLEPDLSKYLIEPDLKFLEYDFLESFKDMTWSIPESDFYFKSDDSINDFLTKNIIQGF